jgi:preprotein translocase subunit SecE
MVDKSKAWIAPKLAWLRESWQEVRYRVTWPSKEEVWGTTRVVLVAVVVFAIIVGAMDLVMYQLLTRVFAMFA